MNVEATHTKLNQSLLVLVAADHQRKSQEAREKNMYIHVREI